MDCPSVKQRVVMLEENAADKSASFNDSLENLNIEGNGSPRGNLAMSQFKHRHESTEGIHLGTNEATSKFEEAKEKVVLGTKKVISEVADLANRIITPLEQSSRDDNTEELIVISPPHLKSKDANLSNVPPTTQNGAHILDLVDAAAVLEDVSVPLIDTHNIEISSPTKVLAKMALCEKTPEKKFQEVSTSLLISQNIQKPFAGGYATSDEVKPMESEKKSEGKSSTLACHSSVATSEKIPGPLSIADRSLPPQVPILQLTNRTPLLKTPEKEDAICSSMTTSHVPVPQKSDKVADKILPEKKGRNLLNNLKSQKEAVLGLNEKKSSSTKSKANSEKSLSFCFNSTPAKASNQSSDMKSAMSSIISTVQSDVRKEEILSEKEEEEMLEFLNNLGSVVQNPYLSIMVGKTSKASETISQPSSPINKLKETPIIEVKGTALSTESDDDYMKTQKSNVQKYVQMIKSEKRGFKKPRFYKLKPAPKRESSFNSSKTLLISDFYSEYIILPYISIPEVSAESDEYDESKLPPLVGNVYTIFSLLPSDQFVELTETSEALIFNTTSIVLTGQTSHTGVEKNEELLEELIVEYVGSDATAEN